MGYNSQNGGEHTPYKVSAVSLSIKFLILILHRAGYLTENKFNVQGESELIIINRNSQQLNGATYFRAVKERTVFTLFLRNFKIAKEQIIKK